MLVFISFGALRNSRIVVFQECRVDPAFLHLYDRLANTCKQERLWKLPENLGAVHVSRNCALLTVAFKLFLQRFAQTLTPSSLVRDKGATRSISGWKSY